ncbi:1,2-phenylacetyl-CoA epoxidase subunit PaaE [Natronosporangium hydrolyticum]|uniref:1,2-phenylacetyl-CoA epoxidase subunit PaaE n=1 Tax=Natronosporangium hydrolyticum TaxID=2811111 RepID=UPI003B845A26
MTISRPPRRRPTFHALPVVALDPLTDDALAVTFAVPEQLRDAYAFRAGQHLTVRRVDPDTGEEVRRSYSICSTPAELAATGRLRIGVKQIPGGAFSRYAAEQLRVGDEVPVMPPLGHFTTEVTPTRSRWYAAVVAGSGITPVLSLAATALATEPASRFTIFYGNRDVRSVMFAEELADLKDRWPQRLQVVHVLSREPADAELLSGRIDAHRLPRLLTAFLPEPAVVDEWFLCGPYGLVTDAQAVLASLDVPEPAVRTELFHVPSGDDPAAPAAPAPSPAGEVGEVDLTIQLDGRASQVSMGRQERVLDAALRVRGELPYACRGGVCSTCRAKVVTGEVTMAANWALEPEEVAAGYVLTCQASPVTEELVVDYDA